MQITLHAQQNYTQFVLNLKNKIQIDPFKHSAYNRLAYLTDTYGPRMWGTSVLEQVIQQIYDMANIQGFENVRLEPVTNFTKWVRGTQTLTLLSPRPKQTPLDVIGLGGSVSGDVEADVIVFETFKELMASKEDVINKIVLFNNKWVDYDSSVAYRVDGPSIVGKYGGKAMLVRSVASDSISSVHTGYMQYVAGQPKVPCAAITVQDAEMFSRMQKRGQRITVHLHLQNQFIGSSNSNNVIFEIMGSEKASEVVLGGGHIDTWDTGSQTGANDDGGGFITVFEAFRLLKKLNLRPKRTLRFIAWSGQQSGSERDGAAQYLSRHLSQMPKHVAAFESDLGSTRLLGFGHTGTGQTIVLGILNQYMSLLNASQYSDDGYSADVEPLNYQNVPIFKNLVEDTPDHSYYFRYHHSAGDTMTVMDPDDMDSNVVGIASLLYILADLQQTVRNVTQ